MKLSCVIPVHNEELCIREMVEGLISRLRREGIAHEIVLVNDKSTDLSAKIMRDLTREFPGVILLAAVTMAGFGRAVNLGLERSTGDAVAIVMGDLSDDPKDVVRCFRKIEEGYDCVFGSRFIQGSAVSHYPTLKFFINRIANTVIRVLFLRKENDITNAFKVYRRNVIEACRPFIARYFDITIEIPLKAVNRGFRVIQIPVSWYGRKSGVSKFSVRQLSRCYASTLLRLWLEKMLLGKVHGCPSG